MSLEKWENDEEIKIFREYLRIPTVQPDVDYTACVEFLKRQASSLNLPVDVVYPALPSKPVVIIKWEGSQPELPSIILNSHTDVVPVFPDKWTHEPFSADIDAEGRIYARGTQDMKCVGTQYLGAIRSLKANGFQPKRTLYVSFVPDEEIGGKLGMAELVKTEYFAKMNVGFSLDEGATSETDTYHLFYAERLRWGFKLKFNGTSGHGSLLLPNTAGVKLNYVLNKLTEYRTSQEELLAKDPTLSKGDVTTVNLTQLSGGVQSNVVPPFFEAVFDLRLAVTVDVVAFEKQLRDWCKEAGDGVELEFIIQEPYVAPTKLDGSNPFWVAFKAASDELGLKVHPIVCPGATDSRYIRQKGVPAIGFSPIKNTTLRIHDNDEFLHADIYLSGIEVYKKIIPNLSNA
ncbi:aminoacylase-1-like [Drosophila pseudoobscura]|uniref:N-acyl-aliphatic-L-amino acid amidohydrolase n=1 Tax=Drosophila pseudoobscura pseudoobscura TaxID=46245 RepID=A0A6I8UMM0_DROPS|nr:aminoacylase-1 [Drosophila pseudoobscura]